MPLEGGVRLGLTGRSPDEIRRLADRAEDIAVARTPVDTGLLASSITTEVDNLGFTLGYSGIADYWKYVEPDSGAVSGAVGQVLGEL